MVNSWNCLYKNESNFFKKEDILSPLRRGSKVFFSGGEDPLSNVSAGTELPATADSARAAARYYAQDGRHPGR